MYLRRLRKSYKYEVGLTLFSVLFFCWNSTNTNTLIAKIHVEMLIIGEFVLVSYVFPELYIIIVFPLVNSSILDGVL